MGVDLTLMPLIAKNYWTAHDMLSLSRDSEFWPVINELDSREIPEPVWCFRGEEEKYGTRETDPYGDRLRWVTAGQLVTLAAHDAVRDSWENRAVWAYLAQMPPDWKIVLYWH